MKEEMQLLTVDRIQVRFLNLLYSHIFHFNNPYIVSATSTLVYINAFYNIIINCGQTMKNNIVKFQLSAIYLVHN